MSLVRMYDKVMSSARNKSRMHSYLFDWAYTTKLNDLRSTGRTDNWLYEYENTPSKSRFSLIICKIAR